MVCQCFLYLHLVLCIYIFTVIPSLSGLEDESFEARQRLVEKLTNLSATRRQILPVRNRSSPVELAIDMSIQRIAGVDEVNQAIRVIVWLRLYWKNPFLTWNPEDFHNFSFVNLDKEMVWKPDISVYNKASLGNEVEILFKRLSTSVIVSHDGNCAWKAPTTLLAQCKIDVSKFPFDEQKCNITFGSWTYAGHQIDVHPRNDRAGLDSLVPNGEWELKEARLIRRQATYIGIVYPEVILQLRLKRLPLYFGLNLITPCALIAVLAFLSFALPTNHGERVSLVMTVLLSMTVYMLIVSSTLPKTSDGMPIIGIYFLCIIVEIALCLVATCFVSRLAVIETEMPKWLDTLINKKLARLLLSEGTVSEDEQVAITEKFDDHLNDMTIGMSNVGMQLPENNAIARMETNRLKMIGEITTQLSVITDDVSKRQMHEKWLRKWQNAASVLDRLFLIISIIIFGILTSMMFLYEP